MRQEKDTQIFIIYRKTNRSKTTG